MDARQKLIDSLGDNLFLVMRNHGAIVCGRTIAEAFVEHHYFEFACRAQIAALSAGGMDQLILPSPDVIEYATSLDMGAGFEQMVKILFGRSI